MAPPPPPKELVGYLSASSTSSASACDALEEWILYRRSKGDTLFDVSVGLIELEEKTPPHISSAFDHARYLTNLPDISNLTPPSGVFPLHRSQSPSTILAHLLSQPSPTIEESREVILEYVLARETKARDKRPGKGGKGTLSREALEEISDRLTEVETGLMTDGPRRLERDELDEARTLGMTLLLSLRMSLSYFTLQDLSKQLLEVPPGTGERILVQHIRRRLQGEGRWAVGKELEYLESLTLPTRPSLRPAFRSAKARCQLPDRPLYPVNLPAPSKSGCIKLISSCASDSGVSPSSYFSRRAFAGSSSDSNSPKSPTTPLPLSPTSQPSDPTRLAAFAQELLTEYLTREKREYMLKTKWARTGRDQLGKDLGEIEQSLCLAGKQQPGPLASTLVPIFLILRRSFLLPSSPLPVNLVEAFIDLLPAPPDADDVPFREPSVQSATSSLYVNPRLGDADAFDVLQELIVYEKEVLEERGMGGDVPAALVQVIEHIEKRFPDGSYSSVFGKAKELAINNGRPPAPIVKQGSMHRRARSHFEPAVPIKEADADNGGPQMPRLRQHSRSTSLPHRRNTMDSESDSDESIGIELTATHQTVDRAPVLPISTADQPPTLPPLSFASPIEASPMPEPGSTSAGGWWDVVSAVQTQPPSAPWHDNMRSTTRKRTTSGGISSLPVPPGAEPASIQQTEPLLAQLQTIEKNTTLGTTSRPVSTHATPLQTLPPRVSTDLPVAPHFQAGPSSPTFDFSKRQSDATLNEELGKLMISPDRSSQMAEQVAPGDSYASPSQATTITPVAPRFHRSGASTPMTGSPNRPVPPQPTVLRSQSGTPVRQTVDSDSDSDSDDDQAILRPSQPYISPQQHQAMLHPSPRPFSNAATATPTGVRPSPTSTPGGTKPKTRGWKSVSAAIGISKDKEKAKEKERETNEKVVRTANRAWPENDPGRWNKNMVANIMGPSAAERR